MRDLAPALVVTSAACGADILVLEAARHLGIKTRVILPFHTKTFRKRSVADCGEGWGLRYDRLMLNDELWNPEVIVLSDDEPKSEEEANKRYREVTETLISEVDDALRKERGLQAAALVAWDGVRKRGDDETAQFLDKAHSRKWKIVQVLTISQTNQRL